jgi:hypothetical protein
MQSLDQDSTLIMLGLVFCIVLCTLSFNCQQPCICHRCATDLLRCQQGSRGRGLPLCSVSFKRVAAVACATSTAQVFMETLDHHNSPLIMLGLPRCRSTTSNCACALILLRLLFSVVHGDAGPPQQPAGNIFKILNMKPVVLMRTCRYVTP